MTVQAKTLILLIFFIADSPAKHQQSGKLGLYHFCGVCKVKISEESLRFQVARRTLSILMAMISKLWYNITKLFHKGDVDEGDVDV